MKNIWNWIKNNPNRAMFLVPILLVAGISISHVVTWYDMANPINWAIYLSVAIEVGAITALVAATNRIKGGIWFMFGIVTFIQMIGNIFYSYKEIDPDGELFKSWVELTGPIWELMGTETTDIIGMKRWLAFLEGGLLPIISLTSLHFFVKYEDPNSPKEEEDSPKIEEKVINTPQKEEINSPKEEEDSPKIESTEEDEQPTLVEEENPEDNVWYDNVVWEGERKETNMPGHRNPPPPPKESKEIETATPKIDETAGEKLNRTWNNIVKKRKSTNGITRLGE